MNEAIKILGAYTRSRFDVWMLAGPGKAACRAHVMSVLRGFRVPQSKAGIHALKEALFTACGIAGDCEAERESKFVAYCKNVTHHDSAHRSEEAPDPRLLIGVFPAGIVYADRTREVNGDYPRLAFLSYRTLELELYGSVPPDLAQQIQAHARSIQERRGQLFQISTAGQTVRLGG